MIKPSKISRQHSREDEEDEDEPEVVIHLDSFNPQAARNDVFKMEYFLSIHVFRKCVRYDEMEREFFCQNLGLRKACFIDHLEIPSIIVKKDSEEVIEYYLVCGVLLLYKYEG